MKLIDRIATAFPTREQADKIAALNTRDEGESFDSWTYTVVPHSMSGYFAIEIRDETGFLVGSL